MPIGYSRSPKLLKGALVSFGTKLIGPIPTVVIFQYNPESLSRKIKVWEPGTKAAPETSAANTDEQAQPNDPEESFTLTLEFDAADAMEDPSSQPIEAVSGVADRIAALEMLLYPSDGSLLSGLMASVGATLSSFSSSPLSNAVTVVPRAEVPVILFVWGPGRIIPVRITSFSVDEQAFSPILFPIRAKVSMGIQTLPASAFNNKTDVPSRIAAAAYNLNRAGKQALAAANTLNTVQSILGMLPI